MNSLKKKSRQQGNQWTVLFFFLHISHPITAMGKQDFRCQTPIQNNVQVSSSFIVITLQV